MRLAALGLVLALGACTSGNEDASESAAQSTAETQAEGAAPEQPAPEETRQPAIDLAGTGWRVLGEEGAVYTTYFDEDGTYRDLRNGEPFRQGTWERRPDEELCFLPDSSEQASTCWTLGPLDENETMIATDANGRDIAVRKAAYLTAEEAGSQDDGES